MGKFQRYAFWLVGFGLIVHAIYQFIFSLVIRIRSSRDQNVNFDWSIIDWIGTLAWSFGNALQSLAIAMLCVLAARLCKMNEDPSFREDFSKILRKLRKAGEKK